MRPGLHVLFLIPLSAILTFGDSVTVELSPTSLLISDNQTVTTEANISGLGLPPAVGAFDLTVSFDPTSLLLTGISFGPLLGDPTLLEALTATNVSPGLAEFSEVSLLSSTQLNGLQAPAFNLATLHFQTLGSGTAVFSLIGGVVDDAFGNKLAQIPEPYSGFLVGLALLLLLRVRGRSRPGRGIYENHGIAETHIPV